MISESSELTGLLKSEVKRMIYMKDPYAHILMEIDRMRNVAINKREEAKRLNLIADEVSLNAGLLESALDDQKRADAEREQHSV